MTRSVVHLGIKIAAQWMQPKSAKNVHVVGNDAVKEIWALLKWFGSKTSAQYIQRIVRCRKCMLFLFMVPSNKSRIRGNWPKEIEGSSWGLLNGSEIELLIWLVLAIV